MSYDERTRVRGRRQHARMPDHHHTCTAKGGGHFRVGLEAAKARPASFRRVWGWARRSGPFARLWNFGLGRARWTNGKIGVIVSAGLVSGLMLAGSDANGLSVAAGRALRGRDWRGKRGYDESTAGVQS
jgi:hypothetical protein